MDKKNGAVKEVIRLASRIATLRAESARLQDEIDACESALEGMLGGGSGARKSKKAIPSNDGAVASAPKARAKARRGAPAPAVVAKGSKAKAPRTKAKRKSKGGARSGTIMEAIVLALEAHKGEAMSVTGVADAVGANPASVATMLKRLVERGRINKPALGRYQSA